MSKSRSLKEERPRQDANGWELLDPTPVAIPTGFKVPETMEQRVQRLTRTSMSALAAEQGYETFEESEDFNIGDDIDPSTPYETFFDPQLGIEITPEEFKLHEATYRKRFMKAQTDYFDQVDREGIMHDNLRRARYRRKAAQKPPRASQDDKTGGEGG